MQFAGGGENSDSHAEQMALCNCSFCKAIKGGEYASNEKKQERNFSRCGLSASHSYFHLRVACSRRTCSRKDWTVCREIRLRESFRDSNSLSSLRACCKRFSCSLISVANALMEAILPSVPPNVTMRSWMASHSWSILSCCSTSSLSCPCKSPMRSSSSCMDVAKAFRWDSSTCEIPRRRLF